MAAEVPLQVLAPWPLKLIVDNALAGQPLPGWLSGTLLGLAGGGSREGEIGWLLGAMVAMGALTVTLELVQSWLSIGVGQRLVYALAADVFSHLQRLSLSVHARTSVGDSLRRVTGDCGCVATIVRDCALPGVMALGTIAIMFGVMLTVQPVLAGLSLAVIPLLWLAVRRYDSAIADRGYDHAEAEGAVYECAERSLAAVPIIQAFHAEESAEREMRGAYEVVMSTTIASTAAQFKLKVLTGLAIAAGTGAILLVGAWQALDGRVSVGTLLLFVAYLGSMYSPLETIIGAVAHARESAGSARRVREVLDAVPDVRDRPGAREFAPLRSKGVEIRFENVTVGHEPGRPVLHEITLSIGAGEAVGLVGATGAGKSTLASLVPRLLDPWQGRVVLDGVDAREVTLRSLREHVAIVPQESLLFPTTLAENIAYGRPDADRDRIESAARAAGAHDFIAALPAGYDTVVGERGATLSGGERQRIAIARALLKDAPVLVMDEPTSALDAASEAAVVDGLGRLRGGRTVLVIAHRLSTLRAVDRIIVLAEGRVVERGTHAQLLAAGGVYAALWNAQDQRGQRPPCSENSNG